MPQGTALPILFLCAGVVMSGCSTALQTSTNGQAPSSVTPCGAPSPDPSRKIVINAPCDHAKVAPRHFVEGVVADANAQVWVVIHPMEVADYWVQPNVTVREGGRWKVLCYFGELGQHSGKPYEVMAIANPKETLREGQLLPNWPEAQSKSQVVEVVRE
ncbi:MAG: hypothetical protein H7Z16_13565 [Pyrinomonadaceae bacterium]|nr:hypothetical protein [Pyrinomonadaceae bacterium]